MVEGDSEQKIQAYIEEKRIKTREEGTKKLFQEQMIVF